MPPHRRTSPTIARAALVLTIPWLDAALAGCGGDREGAEANAALTAPHGFPAPPSAPYDVIDVSNGGMITGTVRVEIPVEADTTIRPTNDLAVCGEEFEERRVSINGGRLEGAVVWLHDVRAGKRLPRERLFEVQHAGCRLAPRVQAVVTGGTLNVRSRDPISHHTRFVHLHSDEELAIVRQSDAGSIVPAQAVVGRTGLVHLRCEVHPWTTAWLAVFDHPYFAVTDAGGTFTLTEVPPGRYTLVVWHEALGAVERQIVVGTGVTAQADIIYR